MQSHGNPLSTHRKAKAACGAFPQETIHTVFEDFSDASDPMMAAAPIPLHVREHSCLMRPVIIFRPKEKHREFSNLVLHFLNIWGNIFGMANFCWPPSIINIKNRIHTLFRGSDNNVNAESSAEQSTSARKPTLLTCSYPASPR